MALLGTTAASHAGAPCTPGPEAAAPHNAPHTPASDLLHFRRPGGWHSVTNFGAQPVPLPPGTVLLASAPLRDGMLPANTTVWLLDLDSAGEALP